MGILVKDQKKHTLTLTVRSRVALEAAPYDAHVCNRLQAPRGDRLLARAAGLLRQADVRAKPTRQGRPTRIRQ